MNILDRVSSEVIIRGGLPGTGNLFYYNIATKVEARLYIVRVVFRGSCVGEFKVTTHKSNAQEKLGEMLMEYAAMSPVFEDESSVILIRDFEELSGPLSKIPPLHPQLLQVEAVVHSLLWNIRVAYPYNDKTFFCLLERYSAYLEQKVDELIKRYGIIRLF